MAKQTLHNAKKAKNDEFYTQFADVEMEMNAFLEYNPDIFKNKTVLLPCDDPEWSNFTLYFAQNFEKLGLKKLISTSYANDSKGITFGQLSLFELESPLYDEKKTNSHGKIFILTKEKHENKTVNINDLEWEYLEGDGDFNSDEVRTLREEADFIITNPPFSLFREFVDWIMDANKKFAIIGNNNAITYKNIFQYIQEDRVWLGKPFKSDIGFFKSPYQDTATASTHKEGLIRVSGVTWFTNIEHGLRHQPLQLMTYKDNLRYNNKLINKLNGEYGVTEYPKYDNYDGIEVPFTNAIPSDYNGVMGVPITFLHKHNPEQFEILGCSQRGCHDKFPDKKTYNDYFEKRPDGTKTGSLGVKTNENPVLAGRTERKNYFEDENGNIVHSLYNRIFIKNKKL